jgi:hypothetical protein
LTYGIEFIEEDNRAKDFWGITFPSLRAVPLARRLRSSVELLGAGGVFDLFQVQPPDGPIIRVELRELAREL